MTTDHETGLPELPEGQWWEVIEDAHYYMEGWVKIAIMENQPFTMVLR